MKKDFTLLDEDRTKLDGIVQQMIQNNESEEDIQFVVNDFKSKYGKKKEDSLEESSTSLEASASEVPSTEFKTTEEVSKELVETEKGFMQKLGEEAFSIGTYISSWLRPDAPETVVAESEAEKIAKEDADRVAAESKLVRDLTVDNETASLQESELIARKEALQANMPAYDANLTPEENVAAGFSQEERDRMAAQIETIDKQLEYYNKAAKESERLSYANNDEYLQATNPEKLTERTSKMEFLIEQANKEEQKLRQELGDTPFIQNLGDHSNVGLLGSKDEMEASKDLFKARHDLQLLRDEIELENLNHKAEVADLTFDRSVKKKTIVNGEEVAVESLLRKKGELINSINTLTPTVEAKEKDLNDAIANNKSTADKMPAIEAAYEAKTSEIDAIYEEKAKNLNKKLGVSQSDFDELNAAYNAERQKAYNSIVQPFLNEVAALDKSLERAYSSYISDAGRYNEMISELDSINDNDDVSNSLSYYEASEMARDEAKKTSESSWGLGYENSFREVLQDVVDTKDKESMARRAVSPIYHSVVSFSESVAQTFAYPARGGEYGGFEKWVDDYSKTAGYETLESTRLQRGLVENSAEFMGKRLVFDDNGNMEVRGANGYKLTPKESAPILAAYENLDEKDRPKPERHYNHQLNLEKAARSISDMAIIIGTGRLYSGALAKAGLGLKAAQTAGLTASGTVFSYNGLYQEALNTGEFSKDDASDFALALSLVIGYAENISPQAGVFGKQTTKKLTKNFLKYIKNGATRKDAVKYVTREAFKEVPEEITQELFQSGVENTGKFLANRVKGEEVFDTGMTYEEAYETVVMTAISTAFMGGAGSISAVKNPSVLQSQAWYSVASDKDTRDKVLARLDLQLKEGKIDKVDADKIRDGINDIANSFAAIPKNRFSEDKQVKLLELFMQRRDVEKEIEGTDPVLSAVSKSQVDVINKRIEDVITATKEVVTPEDSSNYANMTEDGEGNFVFYHRGDKGYKTIKPAPGDTKFTSRGEAAALSKVGGAAMYYTRPDDTESGTSGRDATYMVKIPKSKVYDFNSDKLGFAKQAKELHTQENPGKAYDANSQLAYMGKVAQQQGYDMIVAEWNGRTRAQSLKEHTPVQVQEREGNQIVKDFDNKYHSNTDKGWSADIPTTQAQELRDVYEAINNERNKDDNYDALYHLKNRHQEMSQPEITKLIENSDLPQELKDRYKSAVTKKYDTRTSKQGVRHNNAPAGTFINVGLVKGKTNEKVSIEDVVNALPEGVSVVADPTIVETGEANNDEPTAVLKLSRPLTMEEMRDFREKTGQMSIPQLTGKTGMMHGDLTWGQFNPEYFILDNKQVLSERDAEIQEREAIESAKKLLQGESISQESQSPEVLNHVIRRLKKAFPNIKVVTDPAKIDAKIRQIEDEEGLERGSLKEAGPQGFVDGGIMYLDPREVTKDTAIHEFGHIFNTWAKQYHPKLYKQGLKLIKGSAYHKRVLNNPNYSHIHKIEEKVLEEALALAIGERGALLEATETKQVKGGKLYSTKFKAWYNKLRDLFIKDMSIDIDMTLDGYLEMVSGSLLSGRRISTITSTEIAKLEKEALYSKPEDYRPSKASMDAVKEVRNEDGQLVAPNGEVSNLSEYNWKLVRTPEFKNWFGNWDKTDIRTEDVTIEGRTKNERLYSDSSVVVDENGEPKLVYHGSPTVDIEGFDRSKSEKQSGLREYGMFFTDNKELAEVYTSKRQMTMEAMENLNNTIEELREKQLGTTTDKEWNDIEKKIIRLENVTGQVYPVFLNIKSAHKFDADGKSFGEDAYLRMDVPLGYKVASGAPGMEALAGKNSMTGNSTRKDGVIAENIIDLSEVPEGDRDKYIGTSYVVFDEKNNTSITPRFSMNSRRQRALLKGFALPEFYSNAAKGLNDIKQEKATPIQWYKALIEKGGKGTSQELDAIKLLAVLEHEAKFNNVKSLTREQVYNVLQALNINVKVVKGSDKFGNYISKSYGKLPTADRARWISNTSTRRALDKMFNEFKEVLPREAFDKDPIILAEYVADYLVKNADPIETVEIVEELNTAALQNDYDATYEALRKAEEQFPGVADRFRPNKLTQLESLARWMGANEHSIDQEKVDEFKEMVLTAEAEKNTNYNEFYLIVNDTPPPVSDVKELDIKNQYYVNENTGKLYPIIRVEFIDGYVIDVAPPMIRRFLGVTIEDVFNMTPPERLKHAKAAAIETMAEFIVDPYESSHYEGIKNLAVHMRTTDRILQDGSRVLHVEEIQSDWAQSGRQHGFALEDMSHIEEELNEMIAERDALIAKVENETFSELRQGLEEIRELVNKDIPDSAALELLKKSVNHISEEVESRDARSYYKGGSLTALSIAADNVSEVMTEHEVANGEVVFSLDADTRKRLHGVVAFISAHYQKAWVLRDMRYGESLVFTQYHDLDADFKHQAKLYKAMSGEISNLQERLGKPVKDMPYKKTEQWAGIAARTAISMAIDNGYDKVTWNTGKQIGEAVGASDTQTYYYDKMLPKIFQTELKRFDKKAKIEVVRYETRYGEGHFAQLGFDVTEKMFNSDLRKSLPKFSMNNKPQKRDSKVMYNSIKMLMDAGYSKSQIVASLVELGMKKSMVENAYDSVVSMQTKNSYVSPNASINNSNVARDEDADVYIDLDADGSLWDRTRNFLFKGTKWFRARGNKPKGVHEAQERQGQAVQAEMTKIKIKQRRLKYQVTEALANAMFGKPYKELSVKERAKVTFGKNNEAYVEISSLIDRYMRGELAADKLPSLEMAKVLDEMRAHIDTLSRKLIDSGAIQGALKIKIEANLGAYLTRSYRVYDDSNWTFQNLKSTEEGREIINRAVSYITENEWESHEKAVIAEMEAQVDEGRINEMPDASEISEMVMDRIEKTVEAIVNRRDVNIFGTANELKLKEKQVLQHRQEIAPEIRALMGEYSDPLFNYANSVYRLASLIESRKMMQSVAEVGFGKFIWRDADPNRPADAIQINESVDSELATLNGLYIAKDVYDELQKDFTSKDRTAYTKAWWKFVGLTRAGKTIFSPFTHIVNIVGNFGFIGLNGHYDIIGLFTAKKSMDNTKNTLRSVLYDAGFITKEDESIIGVRAIVDEQEAAQIEERVAYLASLGVIRQNVTAQDLKEIAERADFDVYFTRNTRGFDSKTTPKVVAKMMGKGARVTADYAANIYQMQDDMFKIYAFGMEKKRYEEALKKKGMTDAQIDEFVAERIKNTYPTYSRVGKVLDVLRGVPVIGDFLAFKYESIRTSKNSFKYALQDMADPDLRVQGVKRLTSALAYLNFKGAVYSMFGKGMGIGMNFVADLFTGEDEEEERRDERLEMDVRKFLPDYDQFSDLSVVDIDRDGIVTYRVVNADPHGDMGKFINRIAIMSNDNFSDETALEATMSSLLHYFKGYVDTNMATEAVLDIIDVAYNEAMLPADKKEAIARVIKRVAPGFVTQTIDMFGGEKTVGEKAFRMVGVRTSKVDPKIGFSIKAKILSGKVSKAMSRYRYKTDGKASDYREQIRVLNEDISKMTELYNSATRLGVPTEELDMILDNYKLGFSKEVKNQIKFGYSSGAWFKP